MAEFNPDKFLAETAPKENAFDPDKFLADTAPGASEAPALTAVRSGIQGLTGSFSDEAAGAVESIGKVVGLDGLGGPMKDIKMSDEGPTVNWNIIKEAYEKGRDHERAALKKGEEENPGTAITSNIVGSVFSPINKIAKGMSVVKGGAFLGGINAAGMSEADNIVDLGIDTAKGVGTGYIVGKGLQKAGQGLNKGAKAVANAIEPVREKVNVQKILEAAKKLGIKVTPGMLDDTGFIERLESTLANSPSLFGRSVARNRDMVTKALNETSETLTSEASNLSPYQMGEKVKSGITSKVAERLDPIKAVFNEVAESTESIPVSKRSLDAISRNIQNLKLFRLTDGKGKPGEYLNMIGRIQTADDAKQVMTLLNQEIRAAQGGEKQVLIAMKDKLAMLEKNSIMRSAIQTAKEGGMREHTGKIIGREIVGDLKQARQGYRSLSNDLQEVAENTRIKSQKGPTAFLDEVENIPSERIQEKFFNVENNRQLMNLKEKFPEQFKLLRQGKLKEILDGSIDNSANGKGNFSTQRFLKEIRGLNDEAKEMLFSGKTDVLKNLETVQNSLPRNFNPSGTASSQGWHDAIFQNAKDLPTYVLYRGASSNLGRKVTANLMKTPELAKLAKTNPQAFQNLVQKAQEKLTASPRVLSPIRSTEGESDEEPVAKLKGKDKWANDGLTKVLDKADEELKSQVLKNPSKVFSDPKIKELFIRASDLKPGSKPMEDVVSKIKKRAAEVNQ